ncbi:MAG: hypothetical protein HOO96_27415, partial [Polyangiaceae bacterium]|nr:hypothetical protein [Polyangiaceae bacterium]
ARVLPPLLSVAGGGAPGGGLRLGSVSSSRTVLLSPATESSGGNTLATLGFITVGVSAAAFIGAGASGLVRGAALSDLESACPNYATGPCDRSVESTANRGETASTLVTVFLVSGIATAVVGTTLLVISAVRGKSTSRVGTLSPVAWRF